MSKQHYKLTIPNYEIMTNYKMSFKITILNLDLKNNQALLQFDKINNKKITTKYFYLGRLKRNKINSLYKKCNCRTIYYDGTFTDHSLSSRQDYSVIYAFQRVILEGKIYRNKEITLGGTSFIVEYYVELQTNRHFVFGNIEGGDGLFNTKFSNDWYELIFDNIFRNELNVFSNYN
ncbi:hypothetical protein ABK040_015898 [Willaertia magna]